MPITGNATYIPTMNEFAAHWGQCNTALAPGALVIQLPDNSTMTRAQFTTLRDTVQTAQFTVQDRLVDQQIARGAIQLQKQPLLERFNQFTGKLDAKFRRTPFHDARPKAPSLRGGQLAFTQPLVEALKLWAKINAAPAPPGVTLPLLLADGTTQSAFASAVAALQFAYATEKDAAQNTALARSVRDQEQARAYTVMKAYRETVPPDLAMHPALVETLPRLTPLPGHTPAAVNASGVFVAPDQARVVYGASEDAALLHYQLRGTVGEDYDEDDAVALATRGPEEAREFLTKFGLGQPGARIALKVYVILTTGNEAGGAALRVERPLAIPIAA